VIDLDDKDDDELGDDDGKKSKASAVRTPKSPRGPKAAKAIEDTPEKVQKPSRQAAKAKLSPAKMKMALASAPGRRASDETAAAAAGMGKRSILQKIKASEFQSSTKIEALLDEINKMMCGDTTNKCIVFSQFGAMLELVEFRIKRAGLACVVLRGGMSIQARNDSLTTFNNDPDMRIILISLKAGGEGLNLQVANYVFLLDPWWNPACEMQAIQRAHRIGQTRKVNAVRFITKDTVEEKIVKLQEKKQLVFDGAIDGSAASIQKLTEQDLRFLFAQ